MLTEQGLVLGKVLFLFLILRINERLNNRTMGKGSEVQPVNVMTQKLTDKEGNANENKTGNHHPLLAY